MTKNFPKLFRNLKLQVQIQAHELKHIYHNIYVHNDRTLKMKNKEVL